MWAFTCPRHCCISSSVLNTRTSPHLIVMMARRLFPPPLLCSTAPGNRLTSAMGASSHIQHNFRLVLPNMFLPFPLGAAHPAPGTDMQNLLDYTLALWWLEVTFFLFWGTGGETSSKDTQETVSHLSRDSQLLLWKTEAVHLPEMRERVATEKEHFICITFPPGYFFILWLTVSRCWSKVSQTIPGSKE